jgi:methionyl-tRNA formyltransferase
MKVGFFADGPWSHKALELIAKDFDVAFIVPRFDTQDIVLREWAVKLDVPYKLAADVNSEDFISWATNQGANIFVSMSFNQILKSEIINTPSLGFINCHAGALPFYRGRNPLNWSLINDEKSFGVTVHYIDEGIDTGDIILQRIYDITDDDTYQTLLERATSECAIILYTALKQLKIGTNKRLPQKSIHPIGTYFGRRIEGDEIIDFSWPARRVFNFVRAISPPGPAARCYGPEGEIAICECKMLHEAPNYIATQGEVVGKSDDGVIVKVGDSTILLTKIAFVRDGTLTNETVPRFRIGTRLSTRNGNFCL